MKHWLIRILKFSALSLIVIVLVTAVRIYRYGSNSADTNADAAIVLGAAVWTNSVSPVFRERINHAIELHRLDFHFQSEF